MMRITITVLIVILLSACSKPIAMYNKDCVFIPLISHDDTNETLYEDIQLNMYIDSYNMVSNIRLQDLLDIKNRLSVLKKQNKAKDSLIKYYEFRILNHNNKCVLGKK